MGKEISKLIFGDHDPYANLETVPFHGFTFERTPDMFMEVLKELKPTTIIEIGSWIGGSALLMAAAAEDLGLDVEIVCIDTWLGSVEHLGEVTTFHKLENGRPTIYRQFLSNIVHQNRQSVITPFPIDSVNGLLFLQKHGIKADLIYVDGGHDYMSVKNDLYNSAKLLRGGGWILGDDYQHPELRIAVKDVFGELSVHDKGSKFIWIK